MPSTPDRALQALLDALVPGAKLEHARTRPDVTIATEELVTAAARRTPEFIALRRWAWETYFATEAAYRTFGCHPHPKCLKTFGPSRAGPTA